VPNSHFENPVDMLDEPVVASFNDILLVFVAAIEADFFRCDCSISDTEFDSVVATS
jgi:hypothetical protein